MLIKERKKKIHNPLKVCPDYLVLWCDGLEMKNIKTFEI